MPACWPSKGWPWLSCETSPSNSPGGWSKPSPQTSSRLPPSVRPNANYGGTTLDCATRDPNKLRGACVGTLVVSMWPSQDNWSLGHTISMHRCSSSQAPLPKESHHEARIWTNLTGSAWQGLRAPAPWRKAPFLWGHASAKPDGASQQGCPSAGSEAATVGHLRNIRCISGGPRYCGANARIN